MPVSHKFLYTLSSYIQDFFFNPGAKLEMMCLCVTPYQKGSREKLGAFQIQEPNVEHCRVILRRARLQRAEVFYGYLVKYQEGISCSHGIHLTGNTSAVKYMH